MNPVLMMTWPLVGAAIVMMAANPFAWMPVR